MYETSFHELMYVTGVKQQCLRRKKNFPIGQGPFSQKTPEKALFT
jgi:hypothetical protein